jgi:capsular polysaccharide biosynthesis protein
LGARIRQTRRLFLARAEGSYRNYNQDEALAVAADFGFEPVYLEELSFRESVEVMLEASAVIGPHGAGWANALYCQPGTTGIMWTWDESRHDNWFANIGKLAAMDFSTIFTGNLDVNGHNIDPRKLRAALVERIARA